MTDEEELMAMNRLVIWGAKNFHNHSPLSLAAEKGHERLVKFLLDKGATVDGTDLDVQRGDHTDAMVAACSNGHDKVVQLLLEKGANVKARFGKTNLELQAAALEGHDKVVQILLEKGADVAVGVGRSGAAIRAAVRKAELEEEELETMVEELCKRIVTTRVS